MSAAPDTLTGRHLGSYELLEPIGAGGMGEVYRARHDVLGRIAAIKVLHNNLAQDRSLVQRFFNEAKAASRVRHAGMVEVYDFGHLDGDCAFLVMEYLEGETLRDRLRREPQLPIPVVINYVRQLTAVLDAAHGVGIIHRDLKPENIFIVTDPLVSGGERLKLLDFGIAKLADSDGAPSVTQTGDVMGTPTYMSPEQCRGTGNYDGTTDLYALGCIIFEMLAGRPPFVSKFIGDYYVAHMGTAPPLVTEFRQGIPDGLVGMVRRLLEKEPSDRVGSAERLQAAVESLDDDEVTSFDAVPYMTGHGKLAAETQPSPASQSRNQSMAEAPTATPSALCGAAAALMTQEPVSEQASTVLARPEPARRVAVAEALPLRRRRSLWILGGIVGIAIAVLAIVALTAEGQVDERDDGNAAQPPPKPTPADVDQGSADESGEPVTGDRETEFATPSEPVPTAPVATTEPEASKAAPLTPKASPAGKDEPDKTSATPRPERSASERRRARRGGGQTRRAEPEETTPPVDENVTVNPFGAK